MMAVVVDEAHGLSVALVEGELAVLLEAAADASEGLERRGDVIIRDAGVRGDRGSGCGVPCHVEPGER